MFHTMNFKPTQVAMSSVLVLSLAIPTTIATPTPARADLADALVGAVIGGIIACGASKACGKKNSKKRKSVGGGGGGGDAIALTRNNKMDIQQGLRHLGYYTGSIDGSFGAGTRNSIRNYQTFIGMPATGSLSGEQIHDLISLSPRYITLADNDNGLFEGEIGKDTDRAEVASIQSRLNSLGYDAGPVDGAMGGRTRTAIGAFRRDNFIAGGQFPTKRLLALLEGRVYVSPARAKLAIMAGGAAAAPAVPVAVAGAAVRAPLAAAAGQGAMAPSAAIPTPVVAVAPAAAPAPAVAAYPVSLEMMGLRFGMVPEEIREIAADELGDGLVVEMSDVNFGGDDVFSQAQHIMTPTWPADGSNRLVAAYDADLPEYGAMAIFRTIKLPEAVTEEVFQTAVLPDILKTYGTETQVPGTLTWIGDPTQRAAATANPAALASCGNLALVAADLSLNVAESTWAGGSGPMLNTDTLASVTQACGDVISVEYSNNSINIGLWNTDFILERRKALGGAAGAVVPVIKF